MSESNWEYNLFFFIVLFEFVSGVFLDVIDTFGKSTHGVVGYYGISNMYCTVYENVTYDFYDVHISCSKKNSLTRAVWSQEWTQKLFCIDIKYKFDISGAWHHRSNAFGEFDKQYNQPWATKPKIHPIFCIHPASYECQAHHRQAGTATRDFPEPNATVSYEFRWSWSLGGWGKYLEMSSFIRWF